MYSSGTNWKENEEEGIITLGLTCSVTYLYEKAFYSSPFFLVNLVGSQFFQAPTLFSLSLYCGANWYQNWEDPPALVSIPSLLLLPLWMELFFFVKCIFLWIITFSLRNTELTLIYYVSLSITLYWTLSNSQNIPCWFLIHPLLQLCQVLTTPVLPCFVQVFSHTFKDTIQADDLCLDASSVGGPVKLFQCHGMGGNQRWQFDEEVVAAPCCCPVASICLQELT